MKKVSSPFRYPGSKSRLLDWILPKIPKSNTPYIEPFCGGGSSFLAVAERDRDRRLIINDADPFIAAFWRSVLDEKKVERLADLINNNPPEIGRYDSFQRERLGEPSIETAYNGFLALYINRSAFSGIAMSGAIGGNSQNSKYKIDCRWNPKNLIKSIYDAHFLLKDRTEVYSLDFEIFFDVTDGFYYIDPPYYKQGSVLYPCALTPQKHKKLSEILQNKYNWLLSYDGCQEIYDLYSFAEIEEREEHSMLARKKKKEVLIKPKCC